ncbi:MAG: ArsB/NhaD family transporter [Gordonia sp. (in: high G+C Gram-positive bacteria)]
MSSSLIQVLPVLVFLMAIALVSEVCNLAGLFDVAGHGLLVLARRRAVLLWLGLVVLCVFTTVFLSLDTTAVLVAPVAIAMARKAGRDPLPYAVTCVWLANTASLLLPVSNLTNLLAVQHDSTLHGSFAAHTWPVAMTAAVVTVVVLAAFWPGLVRGRYQLPTTRSAHDPVLLWTSGVVCGVLVVIFACDVQPAWPTVVAAVVLVAVLARRRPGAVRLLSVPWKMALVVFVLFALVVWAGPLFLDAWTAAALGHGDGAADLARVMGVGAFGGNAVNNLPAFLALHPGVQDSADRLVALLVGVNAGAVVTPCGTLATLLWLWRCRAAGVEVRLGSHVARSLVLAVAVLGSCAAVLALV